MAIIVSCFWQRAHESPTDVRSARVCSIGYLVLEAGILKETWGNLFPWTRGCSSKSQIMMKRLGAQPSSLRNETTCPWIRFHRSTSTTKTSFRGSCCLVCPSGLVQCSKAKALPPIDDALNGTAFTFFCYFDSLESWARSKIRTLVQKFGHCLFKLSYCQRDWRMPYRQLRRVASSFQLRPRSTRTMEARVKAMTPTADSTSPRWLQ